MTSDRNLQSKASTASRDRRSARVNASRLAAVGSVIDLFCGAGGLSYGLSKERLTLVCGIDVDAACRYPYEANTKAKFILRDVTKISGSELADAFVPDLPRVLVGCAPCQPFSLYNQGRDDPKWALLTEFSRLIRASRPDIVSMENVQQLRRFRDGRVLSNFVEELEQEGFHVTCKDVYCPDYGVPQGRTRLVLLASKRGPIHLISPRLEPESYITVQDAIGELPGIGAGESHAGDSMHAAAGLSKLNLKRIKASTPGGTWRDWPEELVATCHTNDTGLGYSSVYGRMSWDEPAPTITTQFYGFGNGRFGHPEQDRGLSLREGAILQTFPRTYKFVRKGQKIEFRTLGRLIGNAVPVMLGRAIGQTIRNHLEEPKAANSVLQLQRRSSTRS